MTGWLIALGILVLIAVFPVGGSIVYDEGGLLAKLILGPVKILLFPRPKKETKPKKEAEKKGKSKKKKAVDGPPEGAPAKDLKKNQKKGGSLTDFLPLVDVALDMMASLVGKLRVNYLQLHLTMAGDDPADLAIHYGRAQAAGATLMAQLNEHLVIKKQDVRIQCDFTSEEMTILARVDLTITIGRAVSWAVVYGIRALKTFLRIKKQREGGASV